MVPEGWRCAALSELGSFHKGRGGPKRDDVESGVPVVRYGELYTDHHDTIRSFRRFVARERVADYTPLKEGDLVFAGSGETAEEIGKSAVFLGPEPALTSGDTIVFRPNRRLDPLFLGYASNGPAAVAHKQSVGQGSSVMHIYTRDLKTLELLVPPLPEQRKIAAILSSVDDAIAATRKVIEQTERVKQGLLQTLMTRGIGHTRFKQTEIGEIPEAWEVVAFSSVVEDRTLGTGQRGSGVGESYHLIKMGNLAWGELDLLDVENIAAAEDLDDLRLRPGDFLFNTRNTPDLVGKTAVWLGELDSAVPDNNIMRVRFRSSVRSDFVCYQMAHGAGRRRLRSLAAGSTSVAAIYWKDLANYLLAVPPLEEQGQLCAALGGIHQQSTQAQRVATALQTLKRGLMQDLLTGRVRVQPD